MAVSAFTKFECFSEHLSEKVHNLDTDTLKISASNTTPNVATMTVKADFTELGTSNGYTTGGTDTQNATSRTGGVTSITGVDVVWTGSGGSFGPFRYVYLWNDTPTSPADPLIGYWDYAAAISVGDTEVFTTDFGASMFTVTS